MIHAQLLNIVTDLELTASQTIKVILMLILATGAILNIRRAYKADTRLKKSVRSMISVMLAIAILPILKWYDIEGTLLNYPEYTTGITINSCDEFAKGAAIEFSYAVDGVEYHNCNSYHPVPKNQIIFSGGKYLVRYSRKYPDKGRMDFNKPVP